VGGFPLAGVRILDLSRVLAGPLATQTLADLGADVIKVERPDGGDDTRGWGPPFVGQDAAYFLALNRNKRSITVDLKTPEGVSTIRRLSAEVDVLVENFRPGLLAGLDLSADDLRRANPRLVTCSLTAFGADAPETGARPGYDIIMQALTGLMSVTGEQHREPVKVGGRGRHVSVALFDAGVAAMVNQAANHLIGGVVASPMGTAHPNICPYQAFRAADRSFILAAGNDRLFRRTCEIVGHGEWSDDERFTTNDRRVRNRDVLIGLLQDAFATKPAAEWIAALEAAAVPCAPIRTIAEAFDSPEGTSAVERVPDPGRASTLDLVLDPIRFDGERLPVRMPPPLLGQHNDELFPDG
jgi:crotonobetainyl-CoA:carnitine CoA-transferase CaiB-like acyl-CoA transferase